jgi:hypothetical protein
MKPMLLLPVVLLAACINVSETRTGPEYPPLPEDTPVFVYWTADSPLYARDGLEYRKKKVPATEIARLDVDYGKDRYWHEVVDKLRSRARELGGDIVRIGEGRSGLSKRTFTAIVYRSLP